MQTRCSRSVSNLFTGVIFFASRNGTQYLFQVQTLIPECYYYIFKYQAAAMREKWKTIHDNPLCTAIWNLPTANSHLDIAFRGQVKKLNNSGNIGRESNSVGKTTLNGRWRKLLWIFKSNSKCCETFLRDIEQVDYSANPSSFKTKSRMQTNYKKTLTNKARVGNEVENLVFQRFKND